MENLSFTQSQELIITCSLLNEQKRLENLITTVSEMFNLDSDLAKEKYNITSRNDLDSYVQLAQREIFEIDEIMKKLKKNGMSDFSGGVQHDI